MNYILTDVGGTQTRIGLSHDLETIVDKVIYDTPQDFEEGIETYIQKIKELAGDQITSLVMGIAGPMNKDKTQLIRAPHLTDWCGKNIKSVLESRLNTKAFLENDTALVGLGEATEGAGKEFNIVVYITISTGIGGARIVNGKIDHNSHGFEPGHQVIDMDGDRLITLEEVSSGSYHKKAQNPDEFINKANKNIAIGIYNSMLHWSPDIIVLGGGMVNYDRVSIEKIEQELKEINTIFSETPKLIKATLGDVGGLYGGMSYLRNRQNLMSS